MHPDVSLLQPGANSSLFIPALVDGLPLNNRKNTEFLSQAVKKSFTKIKSKDFSMMEKKVPVL